jgi:hypothetical protein
LDVCGFLLCFDEGGALPLDCVFLFPNVRVDLGKIALTLSVFLLRLLQLLFGSVLLLLTLGQVLSFDVRLLLALLDAALVVVQLEQLKFDLSDNNELVSI